MHSSSWRHQSNNRARVTRHEVIHLSRRRFSHYDVSITHREAINSIPSAFCHYDVITHHDTPDQEDYSLRYDVIMSHLVISFSFRALRSPTRLCGTLARRRWKPLPIWNHKNGRYVFLEKFIAFFSFWLLLPWKGMFSSTFSSSFCVLRSTFVWRLETLPKLPQSNQRECGKLGISSPTPNSKENKNNNNNEGRYCFLGNVLFS